MRRKIRTKMAQNHPFTHGNMEKRGGFFMLNLNDLNEAQREAAMHIDGPCVVVAGAGSGKTAMLVTRVNELIKSGVPPNRILCCTFTKKATKEMQERIVRDIGSRGKSVVVSTIHALAMRMVMPRMEGWTLATKTEWMFEVVLGPKSRVNRYGTGLSGELKLEDAMMAVSKAKNSKEKPHQIEDPIIRAVYQSYEALKDARKMLDFDDLLLRANEFMKNDVTFAKQMQSRFTHISVDEFQDVNLVQWDLIRSLVEQHHNLLVVGDDAQSIYGFRGARPELILQFARYYPAAKTILLERNYRSLEPVIVASNRVIKLNKRQFHKKVVANRKGGEPVRTIQAKDEYDQVDQILKIIHSLKMAFSEVKWSDFAVLYRTNQESIPFEELFMEHDVPYELTDGTHFFENFKVKPIISYLRVMNALNRDELPDMDDLMTTLKNPKGQMKREAIERVQIHGMEVMDTHVDYRSYMDNLAELMDEDQPVKFISKLKQVYPELTKIEEGETWLTALTRISSKFSTIQAFLMHVDYTLRQAKQPKEDAIRCMSIHQSKGLEFGTVFVANLVEGVIPYQRAITEGDIEEETRLFYVAMTRAKDRLYLAVPKTIAEKPCIPSRYLEEIRRS